MLAPLAALALAATLHPVPAAASAALEALLSSHSADSLISPLRRYETARGRSTEAGEAALVLGQLHYARGEFVPAAAAFARAAARLGSPRRLEARYGAGLAWIALREPEQARAAFEEAAAGGPRAAEARLGLAIAWEQEGRLDRAHAELTRLLARDPGEAGPGALQRLAAVAERLGRAEEASRARARLIRDYPASMEAAEARVAARREPAE